MSYEPVTYCEGCKEPFDVYREPTDRFCEGCLESQGEGVAALYIEQACAILDELAYCLDETHRQDQHDDDDPETTCSYCRAIAAANSFINAHTAPEEETPT